ncbi:MAG: dihydroorotate dehydrogenase [bacterium]
MSDKFEADLSVELGPLKLKNPVLVSSGTFGYGEEYGDFYDPSRLGGMVTKSITLEEREGNPPPRMVETPCGTLNSIGLQNVGVERFLREKLPVLRGIETVRIVSIAGSTPDEYAEVARRLDGAAGVDAIEVNASCPNVRRGGISFGSSPGQLSALTAAVRSAARLPLIVKLSPNVTSVEEIGRAAVDAGADALSLLNTFRGMAIDVETRRPLLGGVTGGLSGPAIKPLALWHVYQLTLNLDVPVIGMGGISTGTDALEFILAGANAVAVGTANFVQPLTPVNVIRDIEDYCRSHRVSAISSLVGAARRTGAEPLPER